MKNIPIMTPSLPDLNEYKSIIDDIFESKMLSNFSKYSKLFESEACKTTSNQFGLSIGSCDIGLVMAIATMDLKKGSEVIVPSFTFASTANAIVRCGLVPKFIDIDKDTFNIDANKIEELITDNTSAIMPVHIFGLPYDMKEIHDMSRAHKLKIIADCAHAFGSKYQNTSVGSCTYSDIECFSFSGTKLVTSGEGGLICSSSKIMHDKLELYRGFGFKHDYNCKYIGVNGKISEMNAGMGYLTCKSIKVEIDKRKYIASAYRDILESNRNISFQHIPCDRTSTYKDFIIKFDNGKRDEVERHLFNNGISTKRYFFPCHMMDVYKDMFGNISLPITEDIYKNTLCVPIYYSLSHDDVAHICALILEVCK